MRTAAIPRTSIRVVIENHVTQRLTEQHQRGCDHAHAAGDHPDARTSHPSHGERPSDRQEAAQQPIDADEVRELFLVPVREEDCRTKQERERTRATGIDQKR